MNNPILTPLIESEKPPEPEPFVCSNCGSNVTNRRARGRCRGCYEYFRRHGRERVITGQPQQAVPSIDPWQPVDPTEGRRCDCHRAAIWALTVPSAQRGKVKLYLCDRCAALERSLTPASSWKGD